MKDAGSALMGIGRATGENRALEAARQAVASPLLEINISGAQGILFNITGGSNLTLWEVTEAAEEIRAAADPEANIIFGTSFNERLGEEVMITVIATGFDGRRRPDAGPHDDGRAASRAPRRPPRRGRCRRGRHPGPGAGLPRGARAPALRDRRRAPDRATSGRAGPRRSARSGETEEGRRLRRRRPRNPVVPAPTLGRGAGIAHAALPAPRARSRTAECARSRARRRLARTIRAPLGRLATSTGGPHELTESRVRARARGRARADRGGGRAGRAGSGRR